MIAVRSIWRVALILGVCLMGANSLGAQTVNPEAYRSRVLALKDADKGQRVVVLRDGDVLPSGALFRVEITPLKRITLEVFLEAAQGEKTELYRSSDLAPGEVVILPGKSQWYELDSHPGLETISVVGQEISATPGVSNPQILASHMITHMSGDYPGDFADPENPETVRARNGGSESAKLRVSELVGGRIPPEPGLIESYVAGVRRYGYELPISTKRGAKDVELYRRIAPGVVLIFAGSSQGSGSVLSKDGKILTNWHVVQDSDVVGVAFKPPSGTTGYDVYVAKVIKRDEVADLALLQLLTLPKKLTPVPLGSMDAAKVGADVHAIGHPGGENWTYTKGIISQVRPDYLWPGDGDVLHKATVIQTQTPLNPGNSGGPLLADDGRLIGVNSFVIPEYSGLNYAVAVSEVEIFLLSSTSRKSKEPRINCEPTIYKMITNKKLKVSKIPVDTDCNDIPDTWLIDDDLDGEIDYLMKDSDEDGTWDMKLIIQKNVGIITIFYNSEQTVSAIGYDYDKDGVIDRYTAP